MKKLCLKKGGPLLSSKKPNFKVDLYGNPITSSVSFVNERSYYDPISDQIYLDKNTPKEYLPKVLAHENFHSFQSKTGNTRFFENKLIPLKRPSMVSTEENASDYYDRKKNEINIDTDRFLNKNPEFLFAPFDTFRSKIEDSQYDNPYSEEGEAEYYQHTGKIFGFKKGGSVPLKRSDTGFKNGGKISNPGPNSNLDTAPLKLDDYTPTKPLTPEEYQNNIRLNYHDFYRNHPTVGSPKNCTIESGMNCINGVTTFINEVSGRPLEKGPWDSSLGKGKVYSGNAAFADNAEAEGYYRLNGEDVSKTGFYPGDVIQYSRYKKNAHRFPGEVTTKNAYDLYPEHAKIVVDKHKDINGNVSYTLLDNGGMQSYKTKDITEKELMDHYYRGYNGGLVNNWDGLIVQRYGPDELLNRKAQLAKEEAVLQGKNQYAAAYKTPSDYSFYETDALKGKVKTDKSDFAEKVWNVYKTNYTKLGKMADLPPEILDQLVIKQIGIAGKETKFGNDMGVVKSIIPDSLIPLSRRINTTIKNTFNVSDSSWRKDYYDKNKEALKAQYPKSEDFTKAIQDKYGDDGRGAYYAELSPRSKGIWQQKELSKRGSVVVDDLETADFDHQFLASISLAIDNYHKVQKKYPELSSKQLIDLTSLMHNSPGKAFIPEFVNYYLKNNDIDYVNDVNSFIPEYSKKELQQKPSLKQTEVDAIKAMIAANKNSSVPLKTKK